MEIDFKKVAKAMRPECVNIAIPNAEKVLRDGFSWATNNSTIWSDENYLPVAEWLKNNDGRGLLMMGGCGLGKSLIGMYILPVIFKALGLYYNVLTAQEMADNFTAVSEYKIIYIDDLGLETIKNNYGEKVDAFVSLVDLAEKKGKLLVISTNLGIDQLTERYGVRTIDRLKALTKCVVMTGASNRK